MVWGFVLLPNSLRDIVEDPFCDIGKHGEISFQNASSTGRARDYLQSVLQELVHLGEPGGNAEVDGPVANFDDKTALDVGVDLRLELTFCFCLGVERR